MTFTRDRKILRRQLLIAIGVMMAIFCALIISRGGVPFGTMRVKDFSLCEANLRDGKPQPLESLVLTPTNEVYGCGCMVVEQSESTVKCLDFYLDRATEEESAELSAKYCLLSRSQYFLYPVSSTQLRNPGKYVLWISDSASQEWAESIAFEIRSTGK